MPDALWESVDRYLGDQLIGNDPALTAALEAGVTAGLPQIQVSPPLGKLLHLLARSIEARTILEIGTLAGYSAIWLARALPSGGSLVTLEIDPRHAEVARANLARAGVADLVDVRVGAALDTLPALAAEMATPFDFVFIDADKANIPEYFEWALRLTRHGSLIVVDNVVRGGEVADSNSRDESVRGVRRLFEMLRDDRRVSASAVQTVGSKGYDGFALALVVADR